MDGLIALLRSGLTRQAFMLGRALFDAWLLLEYYGRDEQAAILYIGSQAHKRSRGLNLLRANAPAYTRTLDDAFQMVKEATSLAERSLPELAKSAASAEVRVTEAIPIVAECRVREGVAGRDRSVDEEIEALYNLYFTLNHVASQELHHTQVTLATTLDVAPGGFIRGVQPFYLSANILLQMYTEIFWSCFAMTVRLREIPLHDAVDRFEIAIRANGTRLQHEA